MWFADFAPVWFVGLAAFGFWRRFADLRWVAIGWVLLIAATVAVHGKPYYPAGAYPLLMAGGAVALAAGMAVTAPLVMPVPPVESFIVYQRWLGLQPRTGERVTLGMLPQYFADMFSWRELAEAVGKAYAALPVEDQRRAVFFGRNYGEAAAIDVFGRPWNLPPAISAHESYFLWGPRGHDGSEVLLLGSAREQLLIGFRQWSRSAGSTIPRGCQRSLARHSGFVAIASRSCSSSGRACATTADPPSRVIRPIKNFARLMQPIIRTRRSARLSAFHAARRRVSTRNVVGCALWGSRHFHANGCAVPQAVAREPRDAVRRRGSYGRWSRAVLP